MTQMKDGKVKCPDCGEFVAMKNHKGTLKTVVHEGPGGIRCIGSREPIIVK